MTIRAGHAVCKVGVDSKKKVQMARIARVLLVVRWWHEFTMIEDGTNYVEAKIDEDGKKNRHAGKYEENAEDVNGSNYTKTSI